MKRLFTSFIVVLIVISLHNFSFASNHKTDKSISERGVVKHKDGKPLPGATITEKGTKNAVVSRENGGFIFPVNEGDILTVTYVGFEPQDVPVTAGDMAITMIRRDNFSEVVVTALGIKKEKAKISYATQQVKGSALGKAPQANVAENLVGKIAGLNILTKTNLFENLEIYLEVRQHYL